MSNVPTNLIPSRITQLPEYGGSSTLGYMPYVIDGRTFKVQFSNIAAVGAVPSSRTIATGTGLTGGGDLSQNRTIAIANGGVGQAQLSLTGVTAGTYGSGSAVPVVTVDDTGRVTSATTTPVTISGYVPDTRSVLAGAGLTGGGPLSSDVTLSVSFSSSTPEPLGTATAGVSPVASREDHVHPAVDLSDADQTQGALPLGRGGTGDALSPIAGAVVYSDATHFVLSAVGTPGQVLTSDGVNAPYWTTVTGTGTVTSVNASGGTTGLTFTGGPITASGTLTLGGTLAVASGGTGATTASVARTNLGAAASGANSDITSMSGLTGGIATPDYVTFDTAPTGVPTTVGTVYWDGGQTLNVQQTANVVGKVNEDNYYYIKASGALSKGQLVMFTGAVGASGVLTGGPATGLGVNDGVRLMGVAAEDIALNGFGMVQWSGTLRGFNTTGSPYGETWADGDILYYNPAYAGGLTKTEPTAPNVRAVVAAVVNAGSGGSGSVVIRLSVGSVLGGTDSNVYINGLANGDILQYDGTDQRWENHAPSTVSVGTATNLAGGTANQIAYQTGAGATGFIAAPTVANTYLEWSGSAFQWSANPLGTVTSVAATGGTGISVTGSPITTSGTLTITNTAPDQVVSLTGAGTTTVTGTYPNFTITSNDQYAGTVTSVAASGGTTGLTFSGSPITTSGTLTLGGTLAIASGGTNGSATPTAGAVAYGTGTAYAFTSAGTAGQVLVSNGTSAPTFGAVDGGTF